MLLFTATLVWACCLTAVGVAKIINVRGMKYIETECSTSGRHVAAAIRFCTVEPNICGVQ
jgi:hypothetical protein